MSNFITWLESKQFNRLIPQEVLSQIPLMKDKAEQLTNAYHADKNSVPPYTEFAKYPDPFFPDSKIIVAFLTIEEWKRVKAPPGQGVATTEPNPDRYVYYRIPMTGYDTIYHELVHAYDPKLAKKISMPQRLNGVQNNRTPHEIDAYIGGFIDLMKDKLNKADPAKRNQMVDELKTWMRNEKTDSSTESWNLPALLSGMMVHHLLDNPQVKKRFMSILYSVLDNE